MTKESLETKIWSEEDMKALTDAFQQIYNVIDRDPNREGIKESPKRTARGYAEMLTGQLYTNQEIADLYAKVFPLDDDLDNDEPDLSLKNGLGRDLVLQKDISVYSLCEHHFLPMYDMKVAIAYIPKDKVIGLSKMARIAKMCSKRIGLQEKLGRDINEVMRLILDTDDVAVIIQGKHMCMSARGAEAREANTVTSCLTGRFKEVPALREELMSLLDLNTLGKG